MAEQIVPINAQVRLDELLGEEQITTTTQTAPNANFTGNIFEDVLSKAIDALNGISQAEVYTNQVIGKYLKGEVELHEVMVTQSKMSVMSQLAVTVITSAVNTFKEIIQMQV